MTVDQNEATADLQSRRAFLTLGLLGVAAAMALGVTEIEAAAPNTGDRRVPVDREITPGEKAQLAETVGQGDRVRGAYDYYGHYRRVYRRSYRRTRRYVRRAYRRSYYY
jgi:hypothetical protein